MTKKRKSVILKVVLYPVEETVKELMESIENAGRALRRESGRFVCEFFLKEFSETVVYPKKKKEIAFAVAEELRRLLGGKNGSDIMALFLYADHEIICGREEGEDTRVEYGIGTRGLFRRILHRQKKPHAPWRVREVEIVSPEELLYHAKYPGAFYDSILTFLGVTAKTILRQREEKGRRKE